MTPRCGRTPYGHWKTTCLAALRHDALTALMVTDGTINGALYLAWVRGFLCPTLQLGDVVIADNLSSHQAAGVREALRKQVRRFATCHLIHLI